MIDSDKLSVLNLSLKSFDRLKKGVMVAIADVLCRTRTLGRVRKRIKSIYKKQLDIERFVRN